MADRRAFTSCYSCKGVISETGSRFLYPPTGISAQPGSDDFSGWCDDCQNEYRREVGGMPPAASTSTPSPAAAEGPRLPPLRDQRLAPPAAQAPRLPPLWAAQHLAPLMAPPAPASGYSTECLAYNPSFYGPRQLPLPHSVSNLGQALSAYEPSTVSGYSTDSHQQYPAYGYQRQQGVAPPPSFVSSTASDSRYAGPPSDIQSVYPHSSVEWSGYHQPSEASTGAPEAAHYRSYQADRRLVQTVDCGAVYTVELTEPPEPIRHMYVEDVDVYGPGWPSWRLVYYILDTT